MIKAPDPTLLNNLDPNESPFPNPSSPTGSNGTTQRVLPSRAVRRSRRWLWITVFICIGCVAGDVAAHFFLGKSLVTDLVLGTRNAERPDIILHTVKKEQLNVTVTEKGTLESAANKDIVCMVRAGTKGYASTIKEVI